MDVLELELTDEQQRQLARIRAAQWQPWRGAQSAWMFVAPDDNEALIVLTPRFEHGIPEEALWVVDADDKCHLGLSAAMRNSVRDLKAERGLPA